MGDTNSVTTIQSRACVVLKSQTGNTKSSPSLMGRFRKRGLDMIEKRGSDTPRCVQMTRRRLYMTIPGISSEKPTLQEARPSAPGERNFFSSCCRRHDYLVSTDSERSARLRAYSTKLHRRIPVTGCEAPDVPRPGGRPIISHP